MTKDIKINYYLFCSTLEKTLQGIVAYKQIFHHYGLF
jgi:hypothetical protein